MNAQVNPHQILGLTDQAELRLNTKLQILRLLERYRAAHDYSLSVADVLFARAWNSGELAVDDALRVEWPTLSHKTLESWRLTLKRGGVIALAGRYGNRKGQNCIEAQPEVRDHIIAIIVEFPHVRATRVHEWLAARFRDREGIDLPSLRTVCRWITGWKRKNAQTFAAITNPDQWKNKYMAAHGSASESIERINQRFEVDCTPADLHLDDGRYVLSCGIDVGTRRMRILVTRSAKAVANMQLLRRMILDFGVPELVKSDQGKDYVAGIYEQALDNLDIDHQLSNKFSPWEKPFIERGQKTFLHDLVEMLPGYCGHNVAEAQALRASKSFAQRLFEKNAVVELRLTAQQMQRFCDDWCKHRYEHRVHSELGMTPFEAAARSTDPVARIQDERALDMLLAEVPRRTGLPIVQKSGVKIDGDWYIAPELEGRTGDAVHVRYLDEAGKVVVYSHEAFQFICIAVCPELAMTGATRAEIAAKTRIMQRERVQTERAALREITKRIKPKDAAAEILRDNIRTSSNLVAFPKRAELHDTPALQAAAQAHAALNPAPRDTSELMDRETFAKAVEAEQRELVAQPQFESRRQRAFWIANQSYQRELTGEELEFLEHYRRDEPRQATDMDEMMRLRHGDLSDLPADEREHAARYRNQFARLIKPA